jgi:hypothetical protein
LALALCCSLWACRRNKIEVTVVLIMGEWQRLDSNKPDNDGMNLIVDTSGGLGYGRLSFLPTPNAYFDLGDEKWKEIRPTVDSSYTYRDLGSDGNYYNGTMRLTEDVDGLYLDLKVESPFEGYGNTQRWYKQR